MKQNKLLQSLAIALLGFATTMPALATIHQVSPDNYQIATAADYEEFRQIVATGNPYANAVLTADITVKDVIGKGDVQFHYRGTFDGQGHTITMDNVANDTENHPWGLFQYTEPGCVIKNLKVSGTVTNRYEALGSIVGEARGTRVENCISDATLTAYSYAGGLIGAGYGVNFVENCAFIGSINVSEAYGIIGYVHNNVEIKSCYVDATFSNPTGSNQFMKKTDAGQIFLNNYYHKRSDVAAGQETGVTMVSSSDDMSNGKLCLDLNIKGRNGVVWYQHGDHPYPFMGVDGKVATISQNGYIVIATRCDGHNYENHICQNCGALSSGYKVDPLQSAGEDHMYATDEIYVGLIRYKLNSDDGTATVKGTHKIVEGTELATAVHIPEVIRYQNEDYTVTNIGNGAFGGSKIEYCYIPKTIKDIANNAFNKSSVLTYVHFADGPSNVGLWLGHDEKDNKELFYNSPIEKVYIGRNLCWIADVNNDAAFEDRTTLTNVFFGPLVTRVGNHRYGNDPRNGNNCELFLNCDGIRNIYFMGSDLSLAENDVEAYIYEGLRNATDIYVNRSILSGESSITEKDTKPYTTFWKNGIFKSCANVAFGPYVKYIGTDLLGGGETSYNHTLKMVDFTNAVRLEQIYDKVFKECPDASFIGLQGQHPLKGIGEEAFYNCDKLEYINFGTQLVSIGKSAFCDCAKLTFVKIPGTVTTIGVDAFDKCKSLLGVTIDAGEDLHVSNLKGRFDGSDKIASLYLNREITGVEEDPGYVGQDSPFDSSDKALASVTIGPNVRTLKQGLFWGLKSVNSLSFEYSSEPLKFYGTPSFVFDIADPTVFVDHNPVSSLRIDRVLQNNNGSLITGSDWGEARSLVKDITFGDNVSQISESAFEGFSGLRTLFLSASVESIGAEAFKGARSLTTLAFVGPTAVGENAFDGCTNLASIVVCNEYLTVGKNAFANCDKIEEITVSSEGNTAIGSELGFSETAYENAILYSPYDTSTESVVFNQYPWKLFQHRPLMRTNDYLAESGQAASGVYEHARVKVGVDEGEYEMFYAPFAWDSYYFGTDAEVYSLSVNEGNYDETVQQSGSITTYDISMQPVDLLNNHKLPKGVYAVKTNYPAETISATRNLFVEYEGIEVDNRKQSAQSASRNSFVFGSMGGVVSDDEHQAYVIEDGVIKQLNGSYTMMDGGVVLASGEMYNEDYEIFNIKNNDINILTSKLAVPFHELLEGYATFYNEKFNVRAPKWCEVYVVTNATNGSVTLEKITDRIINAGQAVILKTTKESAIGAEDLMTYVVNGSNFSTRYEQNLLKGVSVDTPVVGISGAEGYVYVLSCNSQHTNTGFYKFSDGKTISAGKAYLLPSDISSPNKACLFTFDDLNGIEKIDIENNEPGVIYDLFGRSVGSVNADVKSIYIINNKKVIK